MKNIILNFKQSVRFFVSIITAREFAFLYCIAGTIGQVAHTYYLTESISSLQGGWRTAQAVLLSIFISSSLLYFTAIADNEDTKESRRVHFAVTMFTIIEVLINIYYYCRHLIIEQDEIQYFDFIFAILVSCLIPVTIKLYSSHIRAKEWILDIEEGKGAYVGSQGGSEGFNAPQDVIDEVNDEISKNIDEEIMSEATPEEPITDGPWNIRTEDDMPTEAVEEPAQQLAPSQDIVMETVEKFFDDPDNSKRIAALLDSDIEDKKAELEKWFVERQEKASAEIMKAFTKNQEMFLQQFSNKIEKMMKDRMANQ